MEHCRKYRTIGQRLIRTKEKFGDIAAAGVKIAYLSSWEEKKKDKKIVYADCNKVNPRYAWCCKYDFFIVVYEPNVEDFTAKQLEILIEHELMHIGVDFDGTDITFYVKPHDIEEFRDIIDQYGIDWSGADA